METQKIEVHLAEGQKELVIREGQAIEIKEPVKLDITGTIQSPKEWLAKRKASGQFDAKNCHVLFSYEKMFIKLFVNETNHYRTIITGKAEVNPDLAKFGINSEKTWTKDQLKSFLKMNRAFFRDRDENLQMVTNLEKFSASVKAQLDLHKDDRGNSKSNAEVKVDTNLNMNFTLRMPAFIGQPDIDFKVEICLDVRDAGLTIWLESPELQEAIINGRKKLVDDNIDCFREEFVVIEQ